MSSDAFYSRQGDDIIRSFGRCPQATALLNEVERYLIEELPAWPEAGTDESLLKGWLERVVIALGMDIDAGRDASHDYVATVLNRMLARR